MDLVTLIRLAYLSASLLVLFVYLIPSLRTRFLAYGARASPNTLSSEREKAAREQPDKGPSAILLDRAADVKVPHSWFTSFYAVSVGCSLFWASQIVVGGPAFRAVVYFTAERDASMTVRQVLLVWVMMLVQGSRRLYECLALAKPSSSQMWVGHWLLGIFFYGGMSLAVVIEGIPALRQHTFSTKDLAIAPPNVRIFLCIIIFTFASGVQHDCHAYLAFLKPSATSTDQTSTKPDYKLPTHPAFSNLIAPHYTAECLIYVSLAIVAAPQRAWLNWTLVCAMVFVVVNLGITADGTKSWYVSKFEEKAVAGKARMISGVW